MGMITRAGLFAADIHVCDLRAAEARWFGVNLASGVVTAQDWWQAHASPSLDLLCAVPYAFFIYAACGYALFLYRRSDILLRWFGWAFLLANLFAFATYQLYPAAPPWYYHAHGCAVLRHATPSAGPNLHRVDAVIGFPYFASMYARASTVFGAVPSMHVAYPLLMAVVGWREHRVLGKAALTTWFLWMCFAAVYLDHHWLIDIVVGAVYALIAAAVVAVALRALERRRASEPVTPAPEVAA
jgi:inositol phosphorylceramide synthase catalytic subunit